MMNGMILYYYTIIAISVVNMTIKLPKKHIL